jgi:hypothetical protein
LRFAKRYSSLNWDSCQGYPENEALAKETYKAIEYKVMVQSSVLSYMDILKAA